MCKSDSADDLQEAKRVVRAYQEALELGRGREKDAAARLERACARFLTPDCAWHGVDPFNVQSGPRAVAEVFWAPLLEAFGKVQRRDDVMLAGSNDVRAGPASEPPAKARRTAPEHWVCTMGHFLGAFDRPWLQIPPTGRLCFVRYCEFSCVDVSTGTIVQSCMHVDILGVMHQAGVYPLPPATGALLCPTPGPRTHDGVLAAPQDAAETAATLALVAKMLEGLQRFNAAASASGNQDQGCPPEVLLETWASDMLWYGPAGIGSTGLSVPRYQRQHQLPFRRNLYDKAFNGHVARIAEGAYEAWFGWPNLTNKAQGGFLGLPGDATSAEMRVVDVYRREGSKLAENWVFIDMLHYLKCRGLDVLARMVELQQLGD